MWGTVYAFCGYAVVGWLAELQAGRSRVRFPRVSLQNFIDIIFPAALWPRSGLSLQQKWLPGIFPVGKGGRCVGLTTLQTLCADCLQIWEPQIPGALRACPGLWRNSFSFISSFHCRNWAKPRIIPVRLATLKSEIRNPQIRSRSSNHRSANHRSANHTTLTFSHTHTNYVANYLCGARGQTILEFPLSALSHKAVDSHVLLSWHTELPTALLTSLHPIYPYLATCYKNTDLLIWHREVC